MIGGAFAGRLGAKKREKWWKSIMLLMCKSSAMTRQKGCFEHAKA